MSWNRYINYVVPFKFIHSLLNDKKRVVFFIDLLSVCKGLYKKDNVFFEIKHYIDHREPSEVLIDEYRKFLNNLYQRYRQFNPFFVTFYDDGKNIQNRTIAAGYKEGRGNALAEILQDDEYEIHRQVKKLYFSKIESRFKVNNIGEVYYLREYESDLIPWYCIINDLFDIKDPLVLKVILSTDKDLLQCCQLPGTWQCTNRYFRSKSPDERFDIKMYDDQHAISYMYDKFKPGGFITSKYIPLILSIAGDQADKIDGIKGIGIKKAIDLINNYNLPHTPWELKQTSGLPYTIQTNLDMIEQNFKMISFEEQLRRTQSILSTLNHRGGM